MKFFNLLEVLNLQSPQIQWNLPWNDKSNFCTKYLCAFSCKFIFAFPFNNVTLIYLFMAALFRKDTE